MDVQNDVTSVASDSGAPSQELDAAFSHATSSERLRPPQTGGGKAATEAQPPPVEIDGYVTHTVSTRAGSLAGQAGGFGGTVTYRLPPRYAGLQFLQMRPSLRVHTRTWRMIQIAHPPPPLLRARATFSV